MAEMHLNRPNLLIVLVNHLLKTEKEFKNLNKQEIQDLFTKTNKIKLSFNTIWLIDILKI